MKHFIIVKFKDSVDLNKLIEPIKKLFYTFLDIKGIEEVNVYTKNTKLANRYDLMIEMILSKEALKIYDDSEMHKKWKAEYGKYILDKTIFDCD